MQRQSHSIKIDSFEKRGRVQIFWNNFKKSKFYSGRNLEQTEVRKYLLSFGAESFVFKFALLTLKNKIFTTITLPVVLYGCETWSVTLREERRLRVFVNRVFWKIFGPTMD